MRVLVTGGAGFIGSHVVDRLLERGDEVIVVDNFDPFYSRQIKETNLSTHRPNPKFTLLEIDIRDANALQERVTGRIDGIIHLAARAGVRPSLSDPIGFQNVNVGGTQNLLEFARLRGIEQFVFASSSSVYGINPDVPWSEDDHVLLPISPYASTKISGELLGHVYSALYGIRFVALRFFTVYGPRQRPDLAIHKFAERMLRGDAIPVFGDGSSRRDYTYIDNTVDGVMAALNYTNSLYEVVNLGNDATVSLTDMISTLEHVLGISALIERLPDQAGDVPQTWARIDKARQLLGYDPELSFVEGISRFVDWMTSVSTTAPAAILGAAPTSGKG